MDIKFYMHLLSPGIILPNMEIGSLNDLDINTLKGLGIEALLYDVDGTIARFHGKEIDGRLRARFDILKHEFLTYIVSNSSEERRRELEGYFGVPAVQIGIKKPFPGPFDNALAKLGIERSRAAMIGDRYLTDVAGANNIGIYSIKVSSIDIRSEPLGISIARAAENSIVGIYRLFGYDNTQALASR